VRATIDVYNTNHFYGGYSNLYINAKNCDLVINANNGNTVVN